MTATDILIVIALATVVELILLSIKRRPVRTRCNCHYMYCRRCRP